MFVSSGQIYVLIACVAFGGICGLIFSFFSLFKFLVKNKLFQAFFDVLAFVITAFLYVVFSCFLKFPNFRFYMIVSVVLGIFLYFKSFGLLLAKTGKKLYNNIRENIQRKNLKKHDRTKGKKNNRRKHNWRSNSGVYTDFRDGMANVQNK